MNAVFVKEMRDVLRWTPLGLILIGVICWMQFPSSFYEGADLESNLARTVALGCSLLALALGLLQAFPDARADVRGYLLHRPVAPQKIFWAKLLAGLVAYLICVVPPLLVMAIVLEFRGPERLPTTWWQVVPAAIASLVTFMVHPAAIWTVSRQARWVGTRWLPLAFTFPLVMAAAMALPSVDSTAFLCGLLIAIGLVCVTSVRAAQHAFVHQTCLPPPSAEDQTSFSRMLGLLLGSIILIGLSWTWIASVVWQSPHRVIVKRHQLALTPQATVWHVVSDDQPVHRYQPLASQADGQPQHIGKPIYDPTPATQPAPISARAQMRPLPEDWQSAPATNLNFLDQRADPWFSSFSNYWGIGDFPTLEHEGRFYVYDHRYGLVTIITPRGIFAPDAAIEGRFADVRVLTATDPQLNVNYSFNKQPLVIDRAGVYQIDLAGGTVRKVVNGPLEAFGLSPPAGDHGPAVAWKLVGDRLTRLTVTEADTGGDLPPYEERSAYALPSIQTEPTGQWTIDLPADPAQVFVSQTEDGMTLVSSRITPGQMHYQLISADDQLLQESHVAFGSPQVPGGIVQTFAVPPVLIAGVAVARAIDAGDNFGRTPSVVVTAGVLITHALLSAFLAFWLSGRRGLALRSRLAWSVTAALFGVATLLAIHAIHPRLVREACPRCNRPRRADQDRCEHCGEPWDEPAREGIEIFDSAAAASPMLAPAES